MKVLIGNLLTLDKLLTLSASELTTVAGGKGKNLVQLVRHRLPVPAFFIVSPNTLEQAYLSHWGVAVAQDIEANVTDLAERIRLSYKSSKLDISFILPDTSCFAVRSSAADEDGKKSFAGQLNSYLNVDAEQVLEKVFEVFASGFERRVLAYRKLNRLGKALIPSVIVQGMVAADCAGVIFSCDPVNLENKQVVVAITKGLANQLVDGAVDGTTLYLNRKETANFQSNELITAAEQKRLLQLLEQCEELFAAPQDIEFALCNGEIYLLQARVITTSSNSAETRVFDGSNIQESYPGINSPMTFSFIKNAYQEVYKSFCRLMGVSEQTIQAEADLFGSMLSYIDGRVYYNLASWYRLMALLPAYKTNRSFMEGMMGLSKSASEVSSYESKSSSSILDKLNTVKALVCITSNFLQLNNQIKDFDKRLDLALADNEIETANLDQLYGHYRSLQCQLLSNWQAPVSNDFFAMVAFGVLNKLVAKEKSEDGQYLYNLLLQDHGGIISAAPPRIINKIAALISGDKVLCQALIDRNQALSEELLAGHSEAYALYLDYLEKFGDRSIGELKLEVKSVKDDPSVLLNTIGSLALSYNSDKVKLISKQKQPSKANFLVILAAGQTKQLLAQRENLRFARTRVFGRVRKIVLAMGQRLVEQNIIDNVDDIFYLTIDEVLGFIDGTAVSTDLRALIVVRQKERSKFGSIAPERLVLVGATGLKQSNILREKGAEQSNNQLKGLGASAGIARGRARVIRNPEIEMLVPGEILVADRTDPGWIVHFASCKGIVVAHGSLLSHTAIVARELDIAAVVSCKGVMEMIYSGDLIEVNGFTGEVVVLERAKTEEDKSNAISA